MGYWERFKKQASEDFLKASEEYALASEYQSKDEVAQVKTILEERRRVLEMICEIDKNETVSQMLKN